MKSLIKASPQTMTHSAWLALAFLIQFLIGAAMVPLRYLQTEAGLPSMAVVALSDFLAFSVMSWRMIPRIDKKYWRSKTLWVMVVIVILRTICITFAVRFTKAYIVQLINLLAPFLVVFLDRMINKNPFPRFTILACCLTAFGGFLMVFEQVASFSTAAFSSNDSLGVLLAILGTFGIASYMVIVKRGENIHLPFEVFYISQVGSMMIVTLILSLASGENWGTFHAFDWKAGLALAFNAFIVEIGLKLGNLISIRKLGAPTVSSMLALRLVAALFVGWLILGERPASLWQWAGVLIVIITVTWYLTRNKPSID